MGGSDQGDGANQPKVSVVLGALGTACWCIQILPQIWKNWRRHTTTGVPGSMLFLWASAMPFFGAYCVIQEFNLAIQAQPQIFCLLCLLCWSQTLYYNNKYRPWQGILIALATATGFAAVEIALVLGIRIPYQKGTAWPVTVLGAWACAILNFGLIVPYFEARRAGWRFIGLSFRFVAIDFAGALFSLVSLATQNKWDKFGGASYIIVMILEVGFVIIQVSWIWRNRKDIRAARAEGKTYDEYVAVRDAKKGNRQTLSTSGWENWSIGGESATRSKKDLSRLSGVPLRLADAERSSSYEASLGEQDLEKQAPQVPASVLQKSGNQ